MGRDRPGGEPTEPPTPKRLRDARKKGQVARSRDLSGLAVFAAVSATLLAAAPLWLRPLLRLLQDALSQGSRWPESAMPAMLGRGLDVLLLAAGPPLVAGLAAAVLIGLLQVRPLWTFHPIVPQLSRLNAVKGLGQMFSLRRLVDLAKSLSALVALLLVAGLTLVEAAPDLMALAGARADTTLEVVVVWTTRLLVRGGLVLVVVAAVDYALQRYRHLKNLRMTKEEVKREYKESEGDPQHKAARKQLHQEILEHDMVEQVRQADLVVVNPTRLAVALRYDERRDDAPRVVAKGSALLAARIREVARQAGVPIFHDVGLARSLGDLSLGDEIPEALYDAVADLLRIVAEEQAHEDSA